MAKEIKLKVSADMSEFDNAVSKSLKEAEKLGQRRGEQTQGGKHNDYATKGLQEEENLLRKHYKKLQKEYDKAYKEINTEIENKIKQRAEAVTRAEKKEIDKQIGDLKRKRQEYDKMGAQLDELSKKTRNMDSKGSLEAIFNGAMGGFKSGGIGGALKGGLGAMAGGLAGGLALSGILMGVNKLVDIGKQMLTEAIQKEREGNRYYADIGLRNSSTNPNDIENIIDDNVHDVTRNFGVGNLEYAKAFLEYQSLSGSYADTSTMTGDMNNYLQTAKAFGLDTGHIAGVGGLISRYSAGSSDDLGQSLEYLTTNNPKLAGLEEDMLETLEGILENTGEMIGNLDDDATKNIMAMQSILSEAGLSGGQLQKAITSIDQALKSATDDPYLLSILARGETINSKEELNALKAQAEEGISNPENLQKFAQGFKTDSGGDKGREAELWAQETGISYDTATKLVDNGITDLLAQGEQEKASKLIEEMTNGEMNLEEYLASDAGRKEIADASAEENLQGIADTTTDILDGLKKYVFKDMLDTSGGKDFNESGSKSDIEMKELNDMTKKKLKAYAKQKGIDIKKGASKDAILDAIEGETRQQGEDESGNTVGEKRANARMGIDIDRVGKSRYLDEHEPKAEQNGGINGNPHRMYANGGITNDATTYTVSEHDQPEAVVPISNAGALAPFGEAMLHAMEAGSRKSGQQSKSMLEMGQMQINELEARNIDQRFTLLELQKSVLGIESDNIEAQDKRLTEYNPESYGSTYDVSTLQYNPSGSMGAFDVNVTVGAEDGAKIISTATNSKVYKNDFDINMNYKQGV